MWFRLSWVRAPSFTPLKSFLTNPHHSILASISIAKTYSECLNEPKFKFQETQLTSPSKLEHKHSKFFDLLEWIFGLKPKKKGEKDYSSWILTVVVIIACTVFAIKNQAHQLYFVAQSNWEHVRVSASDYAYTLEKQPASIKNKEQSIQFLNQLYNSHTIPNHFSKLQLLNSTISELFETYESKTLTANQKRLKAQLESSTKRFYSHYLQFYEHAALYNAYIKKFPHRHILGFLNFHSIPILKLENTFGINVLSTRKTT